MARQDVTGVHTCVPGRPAAILPPLSTAGHSCRSCQPSPAAACPDSQWQTHCLGDQTWGGRGNTSLSADTQPADSQSFYVGHLIDVPEFDCPVECTAEQLMSASLEYQALRVSEDSHHHLHGPTPSRGLTPSCDLTASHGVTPSRASRGLTETAPLWPENVCKWTLFCTSQM